MFRLFASSGLVLTALTSQAQTPQELIAQQSPAALKILDAYQKKAPVMEARKVHVVYWTPSDREPAPRYRERLSVILKEIRKFYGTQMQELKLGGRTFQLDEEKDGMLKIHVVKGQKPYQDYDVKSGHAIREECAPELKKVGIDVEKETIVLFCNMSNWDAEKRTISQNSPYYASGTNRRGTAWQVDSPILELSQLANRGDQVTDGQYGNISIGKYNSIFIGGIAHELGHALGLPHNAECKAEHEAFGTALMGSGNRTFGTQLRGEGKGSFLNLPHGLQLASHPLFTGSIKGWDAKPSVKATEMSVKVEGKTMILSGKVSADVPVYSILAYTDPEGNQDYNAVSVSAVPGPDGKFTMKTAELATGKKGELRLFFIQSNGIPSGFLSHTPFKYPYEVSAEGVVNVSAIEKGFAELR